MKSSNSAVSAQSLLGALALTAALSSVAQAAPTPTPQPSGYEKCYGIAKAGKNDCAASTHSCTATARKNAAQYGIPRLINVNVIYVENVAISPWAKFI